MVRMVVRVVVVVGAVLALGACSSGNGTEASTAPNGTTTAQRPSSTEVPAPKSEPATKPSETQADRWGTCATRLAFAHGVDEVDSIDGGSRAAGRARLHALPIPDEAPDQWAAFLDYTDRYVDLAAAMTPSGDQRAFTIAMSNAMRDEPVTKALEKASSSHATDLVMLGMNPPCDPSGQPDAFGCADPEACTQQWAAAAHVHNAAALDLLAQSDEAGDLTPTASLEGVSCTEHQHGVRSCTARRPKVDAADSVTYQVTWAPTSDGRWYGAGLTASRFVPVASAIS